MKTIPARVTWTMALLVANTAAASPVPCDTPTSAIEKLVCGDKELRSLDELVHRLYEDALRAAGGSSSVSVPHEKWKREKRDLCDAVPCVREAYYSRLDALDGFAAQRPGSASLVTFLGSWKREDRSGFEAGELEITAETSSKFSFSFYAENGARSGAFVGEASKGELRTALYDGDIKCRIDFNLNSSTHLTVKETGCSDLGGVGVEFAGKYQKGEASTMTIERVFLKDAELNATFRSVVGDSYPLFLATSHLPKTVIDQDSFGAAVQAFVVRGLSGIRESIVMYRKDGAIWAAVTRPVDGENLEPVVLYFTNSAEWRNRLPTTIETWRKDFLHFPVVFGSAG